MRVAAVQFKARRDDPARSLRALRRAAERAAVDADLVVLPEMAATGYVFPSPAAVAAVAEPAQGPTLEALAPIARSAGCWLVCGFPEREADRLFNSALVIDPAGGLAFTYRKTLLFDADVPWATPGDSGYRRIDGDAGSFGVGICMDLNDDRFVGWCADADVDVVALPAAWLDEDMLVWPYWALRMFGVPGALAVANTWGREDDVRFAGSSAVMHGGRVLARAGRSGDAEIRAVVRR